MDKFRKKWFRDVEKSVAVKKTKLEAKDVLPNIKRIEAAEKLRFCLW